MQVETENFTLLSSAPEKWSIELGRRLEVFRFVLAKVYPNLQLNSPVPTWFVVFRDKRLIQTHLPRDGDSAGLINGFFAAGITENHAVVLADSPDGSMESVYHEYGHFVIRNNLPGVPLWFEEGVAECYESFRFDGRKAQFARLEEDELGFMRSRSFMPLREFLQVTPYSSAYRSGESSVLFHVQAWALVHYLLWDRPDRRPHLIRFLEAVREGNDLDAAFASSFQTTYGKMEGELRAHLGQRKFSSASVSIEGTQVDDRGRVKPLERADLLIHLGNLLLHVAPHRDEEAVKDYEEALRVDVSSARAHAGLAEVYDRRGRYDQADRHFDAALAIAPEDPWINFNYARSLLRRHELQGPRRLVRGAETPAILVRARELFQKTIQTRREFGEAYLGFAKTFLYGGGPWGGAIPPLEAARALLPNRPDVLACLVVAQVRKANLEAARELITRLARMNSAADIGFVDAALAPPDPVRDKVEGAGPSVDAGPTFDQLVATIDDPKTRQRLAELLRISLEGDRAVPDR